MIALYRDTRGAVIVEYTITIALFVLLIFGIIQSGLLLWAQIGLQHGVEMAARCASVNYAANQKSLTTSCFAPTGPSSVTNTTIKTYAQSNSYGINVPLSQFNASITTCGSNPGFLVTATYTFNLINYIFSVPLSARSCYPMPP